MTRLRLLGVVLLVGLITGCSGGAAGDASDDIGDIIVISTSPGNGDQLDLEDSDNGWNALDREDLVTRNAVTIVFSNSLDPSSVLNPDPTDPQQTRNVRMFYFDEEQGPYDPDLGDIPGVNPPGANVLINAQAFLTQVGSQPNNALVIRPTGFSATNPMPQGQYSVIVTLGVRGADGDGLKGQEYYFYFRVGTDTLGPTVVKTFPANNQQEVAPDTEIRITLSETILASTVTTQSVTVNYTPTGATVPTGIPGTWYTDGGNGPGNNFPNVQLDSNGNPGFSGVSPRNGVDLVFRPQLDGFPVNFAAFDPFGGCPFVDPPEKGNQGYPRGQAVTVTFVAAGSGVTDTAGNRVPIGSPNTTFTFFVEPLPDPVYAPNANGAIYFGDTFGVGVIDVNSARTPYIPGPVPTRPPNSVVRVGGSTNTASKVVRVEVDDLVDMTTDNRVYTSIYTLRCNPLASYANIYMGNLYAASGSAGGGEIVVVDTYRMAPLGRFGTASPGGVAATANGTSPGSGRLAVSNFSANTVTVFDISRVSWFVDSQGSLPDRVSQLVGLVNAGQAQLILSEDDFKKAFPLQRANSTSAPGPAILGTINTGIGPKSVDISGLPISMGIYNPLIPCFSPIFFSSTIIGNANSGESTVDFSDVTNLTPNASIDPDLRGVNTSSAPTDMTVAPPSLFSPPRLYFFIASVGGTIELFATGSLGNEPSVRPESSGNFAPNKIINTVGGLQQPTGLQWITNGLGSTINIAPYGGTILVAETGENRIQQIGIVAEFPSQFQALNTNHAAGLGPIDIAGDPASAGAGGFVFAQACSPSFTTYYSANAGAGTVTSADYRGAVLGSTIPVPGVLLITSWWSR